MPLRNMAEKFNTFQSALAASERVLNLLETEEHLPDPVEPVIPNGDIKGELEFREVCFSYQEEQKIIDNLSFKIKAGEKVAFVGHTGAGKTTLFNLLLKLYPVTEKLDKKGGEDGDIYIDQIPYRKLKVEDLRRQFTVIPQNMFLFSASIYDNLTLFNPEINLSEVENVCKICGIHDFILSLDQGYKHEIFEEGKSLSLGQKQLLSCARAMLHLSPILLLDEATSSVDSESEKKLQSLIDNYFADKTRILIAHRLSTIKNVDQIFVLHKGKLMEFGSHEELLKHRGLYKTLYEMQSLQNQK